MDGPHLGSSCSARRRWLVTRQDRDAPAPQGDTGGRLRMREDGLATEGPRNRKLVPRTIKPRLGQLPPAGHVKQRSSRSSSTPRIDGTLGTRGKDQPMTKEAPAPADAPPAAPLAHGGRVLPAVTVDTYNEELRDEEGFVGDRASRRAFRSILADWRERLKEHGEDPFDGAPMEEISKSKLDKMMQGDDPVQAALVHTVVEEFSAELATVVRRFLRLPSWKGTGRIVLGGGLIASRIGELAMGRASIMLT